MSGFTLDYLARLIAWGLAISVVQGGVAAASWALCSRALRGAHAGLRHRVACAHFAAAAVAPVITVALLQGLVAASTSEATLARARTATHAAGVSVLLDGAADVLALTWLAGVAVMILRLVADLRRAQRQTCEAAPASLVRMVAQLARRMELTPPPQVRIARVATPCVLRLRTPVLLLPADIAARLPAAELEAVLMHELAHVKHGDYGWNVLQRAALALAWHHPAAWMLRAAVRREREMRCDAAAAQRAGAPALARGLVALAETLTKAPAAPVALAQGSAGAALAARLDRLAQTPHALPPRSRLQFLALACAIAALPLAAVAAQAADPGLPGAYVASAFGPTVSFDAHDRAGSFRVAVRQGQVVSAALERAPARVLQQGPRVTLLDPAGRPAVRLTVDPHGAIAWAAR